MLEVGRDRDATKENRSPNAFCHYDVQCKYCHYCIAHVSMAGRQQYSSWYTLLHRMHLIHVRTGYQCNAEIGKDRGRPREGSRNEIARASRSVPS